MPMEMNEWISLRWSVHVVDVKLRLVICLFSDVNFRDFKALHFVISARSLAQLWAVDQTVARCSDTNTLPCLVFCGKSYGAYTAGLRHHTVRRLTTHLC
jgi:hypothetical protein